MAKPMLVALAAILPLMCACSSNTGSRSSQTLSTSPSGAPAPPLKNTTNFPVYPGSSVLSTRSFSQVVNASGDSSHSIFASGNGSYTGQEVIASNTAAFAQLASWVQKLASQPPAGYHTAGGGGSQTLERYGVSYATFRSNAAGKTHGVLLVAMDPKQVNRRLGTVMSLIARYKALPAMMRGPIDNQAQARFGISITQAIQPDSPIGATLAALDQFEHRNARGIVVVEATKE